MIDQALAALAADAESKRAAVEIENERLLTALAEANVRADELERERDALLILLEAAGVAS